LYVKSADGFVLVYSIFSDSTFYEVPAIHKVIVNVRETDKLPMVLVGTQMSVAIIFYYFYYI
jgi:hypothetical protein